MQTRDNFRESVRNLLSNSKFPAEYRLEQEVARSAIISSDKESTNSLVVAKNDRGFVNYKFRKNKEGNFDLLVNRKNVAVIPGGYLVE